MKIIICGAGRVGLSIASQLSLHDNEVTIIDNDAYLVKKTTDIYDIKGIVGHASQPDILKKAGAETADIIIAVTDCDEINMVACQVAHSVFNIHKKIARIRNREYRDSAWSNLFSHDHMPIDTIISPEEEIAQSIFLRMSVPGTTHDMSFIKDSVHMFGFIASKENKLAGQTVDDILLSQKHLNFSIPLILRDNKDIEIHSNTMIQDHDEVYVVCPRTNLMEILSQFGNKNNIYGGNIVVCGGGAVGESVCQAIVESDRFKRSNLIMVERDVTRARMMNQKFKNVLVLNGSALDAEILKEANVAKASVFISVMDDNESNILSGVLAKKMGAGYAISLNNNPLYSQLLPERLIDAIVSPGSVTISKILQSLHHTHIQSVQSIRDIGIDIIEAQVTAECHVTNLPLSEVKLGKETKIIAVFEQNANEFTVPNAKTIIKPGDILLIMAKNKNIRDIESLFSFPVRLF